MKGKRLLTLALSGVLAAGVALSMTACGGSDYDFTVWVPMVSTVVGKYADHQVFQKIEEISGKKVRYIHGEYTELEQMFSTNGYYDVMILNDAMPGFQGTYSGGIEKGIKDGKIIDISDKMETLAPNYSTIVQSEDAIKQEALTDSAKMTAFYEILQSEQGAWYGYMMREDWLKKVPGFGDGTQVTKLPETYDDWEIIMKKFTEFNGGKAPFFLYSKGVDPFNSISAGYDVTFDFQLDKEGKVAYGPYMDNFEEYLKRMQSWYKKGWIDKNFMLSTEYVAISDAVGGMNSEGFTEAKYGIFTQMYIYMTQYENTAKAFGNQNYSLIAVPNPKITSDQELHIRQKSPRAGNYAVITDKCKDVDGVMQWLDYLYSKEGQVLMNYGIEGVSYTMVDGKPYYTEIVTQNPQGYAPSDMVKKYSVQGFPSFVDSARELQAAKPKEIQAIEHTWTETSDADYILPVLSLTAEEGSRYAAIMTSLQTYTEEFIYNYIAGKNSITFDDFRAELKKRGIEDAIKIKQDAYGRWQNRVK